MSIYTYQLLTGMGLSQKLCADFLPAFRRRNFKHDEVLLRKGDTPSHCFYIVKGVVVSTVPVQAGRDFPVGIYGTGSWVGDAYIVSASDCVLEFVCIGDVTAICLPMLQARDAFKSEPDFASKVMSLVISRSRSQIEMHALTLSSGPELRVVMGLALVLETSLLTLSATPKGMIPDDFDLHVSQTVLALICRVSRSVFSECISRLVRAGFVHTNYGTLKFLEVSKWLLLSETYRSNRFNDLKPSIDQIIVSMGLTSADEVDTDLPKPHGGGLSGAPL